MEMQYTSFATYYDAMMHDVDYDLWAARLNALLCMALPERASATVTDCACGTGALTVRLAALGYRMTGMDLSEDMLREAQIKSQQHGLHIPFVRMDMRQLSLHRPQDAIVCACDGVNYLTSRSSLLSFFRAANTNLRAGGVLLFDVSTRYKLSEVIGGNCYGEDLPTCTYLWRNAYDPESKLLEMRLHVFVPQQDGRYTRFDEVHIQRAHSDAELQHALLECGFSVEAVYDGLTDTSAGEKTERAQYVCRKL